MDAEMAHHLGYESRGKAPRGQENRRNGKSGKTVRTDLGPLSIEVHARMQGTCSAMDHP